MKTKNLIFVILAGIIIIGIVGYVGRGQWKSVIPVQSLQEIPLDRLLASVQHYNRGSTSSTEITVIGEVIEISDRNFIVQNVFTPNQKISFIIPNDKIIVSKMYPLPEGASEELIMGGIGKENGETLKLGCIESNFEEMKKSDIAHIHLTIDQDGTREIIGIVIFPRELYQ